MKKTILLVVMFCYLISCKEDKIEFIQCKIPYFYLIKNPPQNDSLLKNEIIIFLKKNHLNQKNHLTTGFYKYTWSTNYFIENEGDNTGGFSQNSIIDYTEENLANFFISKCKKDTTKLVGRFHFYGNGGLENGKSEIDTLIYYCK